MKGLALILTCILLASCATSPPRSVGSSATTAPKTDSPVAGEPTVSENPEIAAGRPEDAGGGQEEPQSSAPSAVLSNSALVRRAATLVRNGSYPVRTTSGPMAIVADLDGDGLNDVAMLAVSGTDAQEAHLSILSKLSRLFMPDAPVPTFYLEVFHQHRGDLRLAADIVLGKQLVLEGLKTLRIKQSAARPVAVIASFQNHEGEDQEWTIFDNERPFSRFSVLDTPNVRTVVRDIDNDGVLDILVFHTGIEAGLGYETFITWFRYTNGSYQEHRSTNIVRNLRSFLKSERMAILSGKWKTFLDDGLDPTLLKRLRSRGVGDQAIISGIFAPTQLGTGKERAFDYFTPSRQIQNIVFPEIFENPFPDPERSLRFSMTVRVVCCNGESHFYTAMISMTPFAAREFSFEAGQGLSNR